MTETVSLREYFEALRKADQRAVDAALEAAKEMAAKHNDLITAMKDQQANFVTKDQAALQFKGLAIALGGLVALATLITILVAFFGGRP